MSASDLVITDMDAEDFFAAIQAHMDRLRETAVELRSGKIKPHHAANRIAKIAN